MTYLFIEGRNARLGREEHVHLGRAAPRLQCDVTGRGNPQRLALLLQHTWLENGCYHMTTSPRMLTVIHRNGRHWHLVCYGSPP